MHAALSRMHIACGPARERPNAGPRRNTNQLRATGATGATAVIMTWSTR
jgi:hypothetical protein